MWIHMAEFTLSSASIARPHVSPWGSFPIRTLPASTGFSSAGSIVPGQLVALDNRTAGSTSSHKVYGITFSSYAQISTQGAVVGIAASSASNNAAHLSPITIYDANPMVEFRAYTKGGALASSHVGSARTIAWDSTLSIAYVDVGASTAGDNRVLVTGLHNCELGDTGGQVTFKFLSSDFNSTNNSSAHWLAFYSR
jgi:hypothetical protein